MNIQYLKDVDVSAELDKQIRTLLCNCFIKDQDTQVFSRQRYYNEMPEHRYMLWDKDHLIAHVAVHDKQVLIDDIRYPICAVAEVCVHPSYRKQGIVNIILEKIHLIRMEYGDAYSILFGDEEVYSSSGYRCVDNLKALNLSQDWNVMGHTMVHVLNKKWPKGEVKLVGIPF
jgi:predicted acetyltransferase